MLPKRRGTFPPRLRQGHILTTASPLQSGKVASSGLQRTATKPGVDGEMPDMPQEQGFGRLDIN